MRLFPTKNPREFPQKPVGTDYGAFLQTRKEKGNEKGGTRTRGSGGIFCWLRKRAGSSGDSSCSGEVGNAGYQPGRGSDFHKSGRFHSSGGTTSSGEQRPLGVSCCC